LVGRMFGLIEAVQQVAGRAPVRSFAAPVWAGGRCMGWRPNSIGWT